MKYFTKDIQKKYLRIPFKDGGRSFDGCDCGGLVWLIYKEELDIELPDFRTMYSGTSLGHKDGLVNTIATITSTCFKEVSLEDVCDFDLLAFNMFGSVVHSGVVCGKDTFMHTLSSSWPIVNSFADDKWKNRIAGIYRHAELIR